MPDETLEFDNTAFVVYVPPNSSLSDPTSVESCIRLGAGPTSSTADEEKTYKDVVSKADTLSGLSAETYNTNPGIALLTRGTINLVAAGGVNTTCGHFSSSTIGPSYTVTKDGSQIISASYTSKPGVWATASFNQASTVAVSTVPLQASFQTALISQTLSGPIIFNNSYGLMFSSTAGLSVTAQLARIVNVGYRTVVSNKVDGSNNE